MCVRLVLSKCALQRVKSKLPFLWRYSTRKEAITATTQTTKYHVVRSIFIVTMRKRDATNIRTKWFNGSQPTYQREIRVYFFFRISRFSISLSLYVSFRHAPTPFHLIYFVPFIPLLSKPAKAQIFSVFICLFYCSTCWHSIYIFFPHSRFTFSPVRYVCVYVRERELRTLSALMNAIIIIVNSVLF